MAGASRTITINAPIEKVFDIITDYAKYPQFLSDMSGANIKSKNGNIAEVTFELKLVMAIKYTLRLVETRPTSVKWTMIDGQMMKSNDGGWDLKALGPNQTEATYTIEVAVKGLVPKSVSTGLIDVTLPRTLDAFKKRAETV